MLDLQSELAEALDALDLDRLKVSKLRQAVCKIDRNAREWEDRAKTQSDAKLRAEEALAELVDRMEVGS